MKVAIAVSFLISKSWMFVASQPLGPDGEPLSPMNFLPPDTTDETSMSAGNDGLGNPMNFLPPDEVEDEDLPHIQGRTIGISETLESELENEEAMELGYYKEEIDALLGGDGNDSKGKGREKFLKPHDLFAIDEDRISFSYVMARGKNLVKDYFRIQSYFKQGDVNICVKALDKNENAKIVVAPCSKDDELQHFRADDLGQIKSKANESQCINKGPRGRLRLKPCLFSAPKGKKGRGSFFMLNEMTKHFHLQKKASRILVCPTGSYPYPELSPPGLPTISSNRDPDMIARKKWKLVVEK